MTKKELIQKKEELTKIHEESKKQLDAALDAYTSAQEQANKALRDNEYGFKVGDKSTYKQVLEYLKKDTPWNFQTAAQYLMLVSNIEQNNKWVYDKDFDGIIKLRGLYVLNLNRILREGIQGKGFNEARRYMLLMSKLEESFRTIIDEINEVFKPVEEFKEKHKEIQTKYYAEEQELMQLSDSTEEDKKEND